MNGSSVYFCISLFRSNTPDNITIKALLLMAVSLSVFHYLQKQIYWLFLIIQKFITKNNHVLLIYYFEWVFGC